MVALKRTAPGLALCLVIAVAAWLLGRQFPIIGGAVFAILIGMIIRQAWAPPDVLQTGIKFTSKKILQLSVILLGFEMNIVHVVQTGGHSLLVMAFSLTAAFLTALGVGRLLKVASRPKTLIGVGTAICGGSAIAATAPVIAADDEEIASSISTIFLFNIVAVFLFPALGHLLGLSDDGFGMWAGTAINDTSSVVAAAATWSPHALELATIVKLTRTLMIVPIALVLAAVTARRTTQAARAAAGIGGIDSAVAGGSAGAGQSSLATIARIFPYFVLGFLAASLISTWGVLGTTGNHWLAEAGKFLIVAAMSAIGLSTNLVKLIRNGARPITLGLACWVAVAASTLIVLRLTGSW